MDLAVNPADVSRSFSDWLIGIGIAAAAFAAFMTLRNLLTKRYARLAASGELSTGKNVIRALLASTWSYFLLVLALYLGSLSLELGPTARALALRVLTLTVFAQAAAWGIAALDRLLALKITPKLHPPSNDELEPTSGAPLSTAAFLGRSAIVVLFALLALDNLGVQVSALIAGLGITSIAVALALQTVLSDLFASLSIYFDKPFEVGDSIAVTDLQGTVEHVGMRTTRLRAVSGEQIVIGNRDLLDSRIRNYKRMRDRRAVMSFGIVTGVEAAVVAEVPKVIAAVIAAQPNARFDRSHLVGVRDGALLFETVYFMRVPDYAVYMDTQQAIYLALYERLRELGVEFSYPVQRVVA